jgi:DNA-binding NarL/FixJ family response regulator
MKKVKILIADDHELIRRGVRTILESSRDAEIVGEATNGIQAVEQTEKLRPDVVIMDLVMPGLDGIEATRRIHAANAGTRVIILTMHDSEVLVRRVLIAGADGYVLKSDLANQLKTAVKSVCRGQRYLSGQISEGLVDGYLQQDMPERNATPACLTSRELEVARLLSLGKSSKEIGAALRITVRTVETHRANIMRKWNVHSVTELLHYALAHGLVRSDSEGSLQNYTSRTVHESAEHRVSARETGKDN